VGCAGCGQVIPTGKLLFVDPVANPVPTEESTPIDIHGLHETTGKSFERLLGTMFSRMRFQATLTPTNDQGADLILVCDGARIAVQAKRWTHDVGNEAVQQLLGGMLYYGCEKGIVLCSGEFTRSAQDLARKHPQLLLWGQGMLQALMRLYLRDVEQPG